MAYRKPFTPQQRREAVRAYRSFKQHYARMRKVYPPMNADQRAALRTYGEAILELRDVLRLTGRTIDIDILNHADASCRWLATDYWRLRTG